MSTPFLGEIQMFGGNFAPRGWAQCDGQLLAISQNTALFSLFGTTYGGDGRTSFGLPDLRGRIPLGVGNGPGLSSRPWGQRSGQETVVVSQTQLPAHSHRIPANSGAATGTDPGGTVPAGAMNYATGSPVKMSAQAVSNAGPGSGQAHNNVQPSTCLNFIVAVQGIFPSRS